MINEDAIVMKKVAITSRCLLFKNRIMSCLKQIMFFHNIYLLLSYKSGNRERKISVCIHARLNQTLLSESLDYYNQGIFIHSCTDINEVFMNLILSS